MNKVISKFAIYSLTMLFSFVSVVSAHGMTHAVHQYQNAKIIKQKIREKHNIHHLSHSKNHTPIPKKKAKKILKASSGMISNAFNFKGSWGSSVDPRTGILNFFVKVGDINSNLGHGPNFELLLNYNSASLTNNDGLGVGWSWNLTHFDRQTSTLTTSDGKTMKLQQDGTGKWLPQYHKLDDIEITGSTQSGLIITYKNGLREYLSPQGYEKKLEQINGYYITFHYQLKGTHQYLTQIDDDSGYSNHSIGLGYDNAGNLTVTSQDAQGHDSTFKINVVNHEALHIIVPSLNNVKTESHSLLYNLTHVFQGIKTANQGQEITLIYSKRYPHLLKNIRYPTGLNQSYTYDIQGGKIETPSPYGHSLIAAVVRAVTNPGFGQPQMSTTYKYSNSDVNSKHDYLGYDSGVTPGPIGRVDPLFSSPSNYQYTTIENNGKIRQIRTYNKYHLLIRDTIKDDSTQKIVVQTKNYYCSLNPKYADCSHTTFRELSDTYSFPLKVETIVPNSNGGTTYTSEYTTYYPNGNLKSKTDTYGRTTKYAYCPIGGDKLCPKAPTGWGFSNLVETASVYPRGETDDPARVVTNTYGKLNNYNNDAYSLVLTKRELTAGEQHITTTKQYYTDRGNPFSYGLLKQQVEHSSIASPTSHIDTIQTNLHYTRLSSGVVLSSATVSNDHTDTLISQVETSLYTGATLKKFSPDLHNINVQTTDALGRVTSATSAFGTPMQATTHYQYTTSPHLNQLIVTTANGVQTKTTYDGLGRVLATYTHPLVDGHFSDTWVQRSANQYNQYGQVVKRTSFINVQGQYIPLTTSYSYDDSGRTTKVIDPSGITHIARYDDANRCNIQYSIGQHEVSPIEVTNNNVLGDPIRVTLLPGGPISNIPASCALGAIHNSDAIVSSATYDDLGREVTATNPLGGAANTSHKLYDAEGNLSNVVDPKGDRVDYVYNMLGDVVEKYLQPNGVGARTKIASYAYNRLGQLIWSEDESGARKTYTYTTNGQVETVTTPDHNVISYGYNLLGEPTSVAVNGRRITAMSYNDTTGDLTSRTDTVEVGNGSDVYHYSYDDNSDLTGISHTHLNPNQHPYPDYTLSAGYGPLGRLLSTTNMEGNKLLYHYDHLGRVSNIQYLQSSNNHQTTAYAYSYDHFNRTHTIDYGTNSSDQSYLTRTLSYDHFGRLSEMADTIHNATQAGLTYNERYQYNKLGDILTKTSNYNGSETATETYHYDNLNNLTTYNCVTDGDRSMCPRDISYAGSGLTTAPIITHQDYTFTPFNNLRSVTEILASSDALKNKKTEKVGTVSSIKKIVKYTYLPTAPLRLRNYYTKWGGHSPVVSPDFHYDAAGNMLADGQGNHMTYNAFNQMLTYTPASHLSKHLKKHLKTTDNGITKYFYNGVGKLITTQTTHNTTYTFYGMAGNMIAERHVPDNRESNTIGYIGQNITTLNGQVHNVYETNYKGDIISTLKLYDQHAYIGTINVYSPYGMMYHVTHTPSIDNQQISSLGFDGERTDASTGWQLLGDGHRAYNPVLRHFITEDPAGLGYNFGSNNPIMTVDPSGNTPMWLRVLSGIFSLGLSEIPGVAGRVMTAMVGILLSGVTGGTSAFIGTSGLILGITGSLSIASAVRPTDKNLAIASAVVGGTVAIAEGAVSALEPAAELGAAEGALQAAKAVTGIVTAVGTASVSAGLGIAAASTEGDTSAILSVVGRGFQIASQGVSAAVGAGISRFSRGGTEAEAELSPNVVRGCFTGNTVVEVYRHGHASKMPIKDIKLGQAVYYTPKYTQQHNEFWAHIWHVIKAFFEKLF